MTAGDSLSFQGNTDSISATTGGPPFYRNGRATKRSTSGGLNTPTDPSTSSVAPTETERLDFGGGLLVTVNEQMLDEISRSSLGE